jgi:hypothetical protein
VSAGDVHGENRYLYESIFTVDLKSFVIGDQLVLFPRLEEIYFIAFSYDDIDKLIMQTIDKKRRALHREIRMEVL